MGERKIVTRVVRRTVRRREVEPEERPCSFCGGPSRPGVEGNDAVICASCVREASRMLASLDEDD
ncbi:MAG: hypothetical protein H6737_24100 [Alphaproteobacteria bacterium]|nr:hypothetical protein [Alphaproteobacteria bacterium]